MRATQDRGQATVELAVVVPVVLAVSLVVVQVVLVAAAQVGVLHAAREGARAAAVSSTPVPDGVAAAHLATALRPLAITVRPSGRWVTVEVRHRAVTDVPLVGRLLPDVDVSGHATMALEPP